LIGVQSELGSLKIERDTCENRIRQLDAQLAQNGGLLQRSRQELSCALTQLAERDRQHAEEKAINANLAKSTQEMLESLATLTSERDRLARGAEELSQTQAGGKKTRVFSVSRILLEVHPDVKL
jgi:hypothetical protein